MNLVDMLTDKYHLVETVHNFDKDTKPKIFSNYELVKVIIENNKIHFCHNRTKEYKKFLLEQEKQELEEMKLKQLQYERKRHLSEIRSKAQEIIDNREYRKQVKEQNEKNRIKKLNKKRARNNKEYFRKVVIKNLIEQQFHPKNIDKFEGWGFGVDD
jgi:hypothetical protein